LEKLILNKNKKSRHCDEAKQSIGTSLRALAFSREDEVHGGKQSYISVMQCCHCEGFSPKQSYLDVNEIATSGLRPPRNNMIAALPAVARNDTKRDYHGLRPRDDK